MRVSGAVPERLSGGDDSSENSSESSCYEVMDTNGEIVHMAKRLTCRVNTLFCLQMHKHFYLEDAFEMMTVTALKELSFILSACLFCCRCGSERLQVSRSTCPTLFSVSTPSGSTVSPLWLLPWSAQTDLPLEAQMPSLLSSLITARQVKGSCWLLPLDAVNLNCCTV